MKSVEEIILASVERLNEATAHKLKTLRPNNRNDLVFVMGLQHSLSVDGVSHFANTVRKSVLKATLWQRFPPLTMGAMLEQPREYMTRKFALDYSRAGQYHWTEIDNGSRALSNNQLAEEILKWLFDFGGDPAPA